MSDVPQPPAALDGIRVVELSSELGAFAGKLLADMGADVVCVEPPGGSPMRGYEPFRGDAPDPGPGTGPGNYATRLADQGPAHRLGEPIFLGAGVDGELGATASPLANGDDVTCAITNDDIGGALVIEKTIVNDDGGSAVVGDFGITTSAGALSFTGDGGSPTTVYTSDPLFVDAAGGDLRLQPGSPAIDAGDDSAVAGIAIGFAGIAVIFAEDFEVLGGSMVATASKVTYPRSI